MRHIRVTNWAAAGTVGLLLLTGACSSNKGEQSPVSSSGDGSGTAPSSMAAKKADVAMVRFVNGTNKGKDLAFGDAMPFTGVGSHDITPYKELPTERRDFKLMSENAKGGSPMATNSEGLSAGKHYTILAYSEKDGSAKLDPVNDDLTPPDAGQAKVRLINLASHAANLDLYAGTMKDAVISGASLDSATDYKSVNPAEAKLTVRNGMNKKYSAPVKDMELKAGKLYTILVFENKSRQLQVKTIEDEFTAAPSGM